MTASISPPQASVHGEGGKLFIVSEFVDPRLNSTGYYWYRLVQGLGERAHDVRVIAPRDSCERALEAGSRATHIPCASGTYRKDSLLFRLRGLLLLSASLLRATAAHVRGRDTILSGTNPPFGVLFIAVLRRLIGFRWVLLVQDVFPDNLVAAGVDRPTSLRYRLANSLFSAAYRQADAVVVVGRDMGEVVKRKTPHHDRVHFIPAWVDLDAMGSCAATAPPPGAEKVRFQFFGNIGRVQGIDTLLLAIGQVTSPRAFFSIVGSGAMENHVRDFIATHPGADVRLHGPVPMARNSEVLADCDVAVVILAPGMFGLGVPSKAYFSMAADKPILVVGDAGAELHRLVAENPEVGWFCPAGDARALAATIEAICNEDLSLRRGKPRELVERLFSQDQALRRFDSVVRSVARRPS